jgi:hypothetical protein
MSKKQVAIIVLLILLASFAVFLIILINKDILTSQNNLPILFKQDNNSVLNLDLQREFSKVIYNVLKYKINNDQVSEIINAVNLIKENRKLEALYNLQNLSELEEGDVSELILPSSQINSDYYKGLFLNDITDARFALSHVNEIKRDGFNTIWIQAQMETFENGTLYIPGKDIYLFYINAFRKSGFKVWLSIGLTSYSFPYRWDSRPNLSPLIFKDKKEIFSLIEPVVLEWAQIAENHQIDAFIPLEEQDAILYKKDRRLDKEEILKLNNWSKNILSQIKEIYSGDIIYSTEDWGEEYQVRGYPISRGADHDYSGYSAVAMKGTYCNGINEEHYLLEMTSRLNGTQNYAKRDGISDLIWYEAGTPMGKGFDKSHGVHLKELTNEEQATCFKNIFNIANNIGIKGIFFKPSPKQIHEGSWNFFGNPAEQIIKNEFATSVIEEKSIDNLWISLGDEGLKVIQLVIAKDMAFDPAYLIDQYSNNNYHDLELIIDEECIGCKIFN